MDARVFHGFCISCWLGPPQIKSCGLILGVVSKSFSTVYHRSDVCRASRQWIPSTPHHQASTPIVDPWRATGGHHRHQLLKLTEGAHLPQHAHQTDLGRTGAGGGSMCLASTCLVVGKGIAI